MATAPSSNDLTRQQLDELDALLQRMLSLPLTAPETTPVPAVAFQPPPAVPLPPLPEPVAAPPAKNWRVDPPAVSLSAAPHLRPEPPRRQPDPPPDLPWAAPADAPAPHEPPEELRTPHSALRTPAAEPVLEPPLPATPRKPKPSAPPPDEVPLLLWPLAAVTAVADAVFDLLGPPGALLKSWFGKHLLGAAGVGLLAYTAARVASLQGWVSLPFPLPWPR